MQRIDQLLLQRQLAGSRTESQTLIAGGQVRVRVAGEWQTVGKAAARFEADVEIEVSPGEAQRYVSRAGLKLAGALRHLNLGVAGCCALDIGQSTGGFSDCLLQHGAAKVVGLDVGHGQLAPALRADPRVLCLEGVNARQLDPALREHSPAGRGFDLAVMDVAFISQTLILPGLAPLMAPRGRLLSLVKPQFELGPQALAKGGIVRDARHYPEVETKLRAAVEAAGFAVEDYFPSAITGGDGNREFLLSARLR